MDDEVCFYEKNLPPTLKDSSASRTAVKLENCNIENIRSIEGQCIVERGEAFEEFVLVRYSHGTMLEPLTNKIRRVQPYSDFAAQRQLVTVYITSKVLVGDTILLTRLLNTNAVAKLLNLPITLIGPTDSTYSSYGYKTSYQLLPPTTLSSFGIPNSSVFPISPNILAVKGQSIVHSGGTNLEEFVTVMYPNGAFFQKLTEAVRIDVGYQKFLQTNQLVSVFVNSRVLIGDSVLLSEKWSKNDVAGLLGICVSQLAPPTEEYLKHGYASTFSLLAEPSSGYLVPSISLGKDSALEIPKGPTSAPPPFIPKKRKQILDDSRPKKRMKVDSARFIDHAEPVSHYKGVTWDPHSQRWQAVVEWMDNAGPQLISLGNHMTELGAAVAVIQKRNELGLPSEMILEETKNTPIPSVVLISCEDQWHLRVEATSVKAVEIGKYDTETYARIKAEQLMLGLGISSSGLVVKQAKKVRKPPPKKRKIPPKMPLSMNWTGAPDPFFKVKRDSSVNIYLYKGRQTMMEQALEAIKRAEERFANGEPLLPKSGDVDYQRFRRWKKAKWRYANVEIVKLLDERLPGWMGKIGPSQCVVETCDRIDMKPQYIPNLNELFGWENDEPLPEIAAGTLWKPELGLKTEVGKPKKKKKRKMTQYSRKGKVGRGVIQRTRRRQGQTAPSYFYEVSRDYFDLIEKKRKKYGGMKGNRRMCSQSFRKLEDAIIHSDNCLRELVRDKRIANLRDIVHLLNRPTPEELIHMQPDKSMYMGVYKPRRGRFWCAEVKRTIGTELKTTGRIVGNSPLEAAVKLEQKLIDLAIGVSNQGIRDILLNPEKYPELHVQYKALVNKPVYKIKKAQYTDPGLLSGTIVGGFEKDFQVKLEDADFELPPPIADF